MKRQVVARAGDVAPGQCKLVHVAGREIGVFNVGGQYFALANRCPHEGGPLCQGRIGPLILSDGPGTYRLAKDKEFLRCPWHGWEFDIRTGQSWCDPTRLKAKCYAAARAPGAELAKGPYVAESFPVSVEEEYVVLEV